MVYSDSDPENVSWRLNFRVREYEFCHYHIILFRLSVRALTHYLAASPARGYEVSGGLQFVVRSRLNCSLIILHTLKLSWLRTRCKDNLIRVKILYNFDTNIDETMIILFLNDKTFHIHQNFFLRKYY